MKERLAELAPGQPVMVCANGRESDQDTDFMRIIADIVGDGAHPLAEPIEDDLHRLRKKAEIRARACRDHAAAQHLNCAVCEHIERRAEILARIKGRRTRSNGLLSWLPRLFRLRRVAPTAEILAPGAALDELDAAIRRDRKALAKIASAKDPISVSEGIVADMEALFPALAATALTVDADDRHKLRTEQKELELWGRTDARKMTDYVALQVLACRPLWAATTLSVPSRVPLAPGIFDYVIFDEANQCDIASALPLMARAKRAVVVGDTAQPESVPGLAHASERTLMTAAGLPPRGMGRYAQSRNSLFRFCVARAGKGSVTLRDQFHSAPAIVDYLNDAFYGERLRVACDVAGLKVPAAADPGISWTDVRGRVSLDQAGQSRNHEEAKAIAAHLRWLLGEQDYQGSIGVIAPFNAQVALLRRLIDNDPPREQQQRAELKIATVDRFRGEMRDIILFSPVAGPGLCQDGREFLIRDKPCFNVAISRARALAHVFGDLSFARDSGIRHLAGLAESATKPGVSESPGDVFDITWERRIDAALRARGLDPNPQYPVAGRNLDFALFGDGEIKLDLEVDGGRSNMDPDGGRKIGDMWRDHQLKSMGWRVRRFWVHELQRDMERCLDQVERDLAG
jgi:very-short-patch-repair endonuclease